MPHIIGFIALIPLALAAVPALAMDTDLACEGPFAMDSSEARLIETYGAEQVWTGIVPGPEGTEMLATRVYPEDADRRLEFVWWDEENLAQPGNIALPPAQSGPFGVRVGMSVGEIEAINGQAFSLNGFGWDYGGFAGFSSGTLADLPGGCALSLRFAPGDDPVAVNTDALYGDHELSSADPLLDTIGAAVQSVSIGYPHPDFRD